MKNWKPWDFLFTGDEDKSEMLDMLNFRNDHPFPAVEEHYEAMRHDRPDRKSDK